MLHVVFGGHNIRLHLLLGDVRWEGACGRHCAFIEGALRAVAIVTAVAQEDGSLLAHRIIRAIDARPVEHDFQIALLCVAAHGGPMVRFAFGDCGHEPPGDDRQARTVFGSIRVDTTHQVVLLIGHDPRARGRAVVPRCGVAIVSGFHGAVAIVAAVGFGVAVVEAAAAVVVVAVNDPILPLRLIIHCGAMRIVPPEAHARCDKDAVNFVAHDRNRRPVGDGDVVKPAHGRAAESAVRRLNEVVAMAGLVVDPGDPAIRVGAEGVLRRRVGVSARVRRGGLDDADVQGLAVRLTHDLVERAIVGRIQRARGTVRGHAGITGSGVDVTGTFRSGQSTTGSPFGQQA